MYRVYSAFGRNSPILKTFDVSLGIRNLCHAFRGAICQWGYYKICCSQQWEALLIEAVESGSRAGVISALVRGENIEQTDDFGHTALVIALNGGHVELAKLLVEKGADINYVDHDGYTPLMWATHKGHIREVQMLLDEGADPHVQNKDGFNCLMMAAQEGRLEIARMLLNRDAHRTQHHGPRKHDEPKTDHGDTALSIAQREANHLPSEW